MYYNIKKYRIKYLGINQESERLIHWKLENVAERIIKEGINKWKHPMFMDWKT